MSARLAILLLALLLAVPLTLPPAARATSIGDPAFQRTWARTDQPVGADKVARTWMWGPEPFSHAFQEPYVDAGSGTRLVQYFDKSRMELTYPGIDPASPWAVTNGLLVVEMVTGNLQRGERSFAPLQPAQAPVAGDPDDSGGPTYATFGTLAFKAPLADGAPIDQRVTRDGVITSDATLAAYGVTAAQRIHVDQIDHQVASVFWEYLHSSGLIFEDDAYHTGQLFEPWYYATGYPIAEAYWATVRVGGTPHDVLMQCFERRCLTYTPGNPAGWQVEAGNVGRHYYQWRYDRAPAEMYQATWTEGRPGVGDWESGMADPTDIVVTPGDAVYVVDRGRDRVQQYDRSGFFVTSWGSTGDGDGRLFQPTGLGVDAPGNVYVADTGNNRVQKFSPSGEYLATWRSIWFQEPVDVAVSSAGIVHVLDHHAGRIWRLSMTGEQLEPLGTLGAGPGQFDSPSSMLIDEQDNIYIADTGNHRVQKLDQNGAVLATWVIGDEATPGMPTGVAINSRGELLVTDYATGTVRVYAPGGELITSWGEFYLYSNPSDIYMTHIAIDRYGIVWIATAEHNDPAGIVKFSPDGRWLDGWRDGRRGAMGWLSDAVLDSLGNLTVRVNEDWLNTFAPDGTYLTGWGGRGVDARRFLRLDDIAVDSQGFLYATDYDWDSGATSIVKFGQPYGTVVAEWSLGELTGGWTRQIAVDAADHIWVSVDDGVREFSAEGEFLGQWYSLQWPGFVADIAISGDRMFVATDGPVLVFTIDGEFIEQWSDVSTIGIDAGQDGFVYVADRYSESVLRFTPDGQPAGVVGEPGYAGPGSFLNPTDVAVNRGGTVYVSAGQTIVKFVHVP